MTMLGPRTTLILGGARSGKTRRALDHAERARSDDGLAPIYIATAQAFDAEMRDRIDRHKAERGSHWSTVEASLNLADAIASESAPGRILLVDCLTLWLNNLMLAERSIDDAVDTLLSAIDGAAGPVLVVSNEVGMGIVPENALARAFRDEQGRLNRLVAEKADRVEFIAAGLPLILKG